MILSLMLFVQGCQPQKDQSKGEFQKSNNDTTAKEETKQDSSQDEKRILENPDLDGYVYSFSDKGLELTQTEYSSEGSGSIASSRTDDEERAKESITVVYEEDVLYKFIYLNVNNDTYKIKEGAKKDDIKKETSVNILGSYKENIFYATHIYIVKIEGL